MFSKKYANKRRYNFPPHVNSVSALPCKTGNTKITCFHSKFMWCFANKHTKTSQNYHRVIDRLSFIHKPIRCMHPARLWQGTKHPANWYAYSRRSPYPPWYRASCQLWEYFSAKVVYQWTLPMKYYATVSQQINCCQTRCWWQFCLKQENAMAHHACNSVKTAGANSHLYLFQLWASAQQPSN